MITWTQIISDKVDVPNGALYCRFSILIDTTADDLYIAKPMIEESLYDNNYTESAKDSGIFEFPYGSITNIGDFVRIFIAGRKVPSHLNFIRKVVGDYRKDNPNEPYYIINTLGKRKIGDEVVLDISQVRSRLVYYAEQMDEKGMVNLRGFIKKPFNFRWHEVYLNGYRVNKHMVTVLSSTRFQFITAMFGTNRTCPTRWSLEIFEREFNDDDAVVLNQVDDDYHNKLVDKYAPIFFSSPIEEKEENMFSSQFTYRDKDLEFGL